jgi:hypothetical protein
VGDTQLTNPLIGKPPGIRYPHSAALVVQAFSLPLLQPAKAAPQIVPRVKGH